ncbi:MAG TPA: cupin domain-containing protein [Roseiflexaceae bacterium]|nr:cupin domain-containing protein [Roseiflexaceae bacterium]
MIVEKILAGPDEPPFITPEGARRRVLSYGGGMMAVQFEFDAGVSAPIHSHPHEQIGYVVSGEIDLIMEGRETARLRAGCTYYVPPNVRHGIVTHTPTTLLDCFTPIREDFLQR